MLHTVAHTGQLDCVTALLARWKELLLDVNDCKNSANRTFEILFFEAILTCLFVFSIHRALHVAVVSGNAKVAVLLVQVIIFVCFFFLFNRSFLAGWRQSQMQRWRRHGLCTVRLRAVVCFASDSPCSQFGRTSESNHDVALLFATRRVACDIGL